MRVYELAKELGVPSKVLLARLATLGIQVKSHSSTVDDDAVAKVRHAVASGGEPAAPEKKRRIRVIKKRKVEGAAAEKKVAEKKAAEKKPAEEAAEKPAVKKAKKKAAKKKAVKKAKAPAEPEVVAAEEPSEPKVEAVPESPEAPEPEAPAVEAEPPAAEAEEPASPPRRKSNIPPPPPADVRAKPIRFRKVAPGKAKPIPRATGAEAERKKVEVRKVETRKVEKPAPKKAAKPAKKTVAPEVHETKRVAPGKETVPKGDGYKPSRKKSSKRGRYKRFEESHYDVGRRRRRKSEPSKPVTIAPKERKPVSVTEACSVSELAQALGMRASEIIGLLMRKGVFAAINERLDREAIESIAVELGREVDVQSADEEDLLAELIAEDEKKTPRAPVVTVMGHVDHGKTSLLDRIRETDVATGETGGITQHIAAWDVQTEKGRVVFLDTPGHAAFTAMRSRGAQVTDVVVLVVAADDGVMPQTLEAIDHIKAAEAPVVVAVNKMDLPGANPDRVKQQLMQHGIMAEEYGGSVQCVPVSAKTGDGVTALMELLVLETELLELRANPDRAGIGSVVEARVDRRRGNVATVLVQQGTLRVGDIVVCGLTSGRVRALLDDQGNPVDEAGPSTPVEVLGLNGVPEAGDTIRAVDNERAARELVLRRQEAVRLKATARQRVTFEDLHAQVVGGQVEQLNLIIKGDVQGTVGALADSLTEMGTSEVAVKIVHGGAGNVNESDVSLASVTEAVIVGLHVGLEPNVDSLARAEGVEIRLYELIYEAINEVRDALEGMLKPEIKRVRHGRAEVRQVFKVSDGTVAGCLLVEGRAQREHRASVMRGDREVYDGKIASLRRFKDDVRQVEAGLECGIQLQGLTDVEPGDTIELYTLEEQKRTL